MGVNPTITDQSYQVQFFVVFLGIMYGIQQGWILLKFTCSNGHIDALQFLVNNPSCS